MTAVERGAGGRVGWLGEPETVQSVRHRLAGLTESASPSVNPTGPPARWVLVCSGLSPVLLTMAWLIAGFVQPASYSPIRQTVSVLSGRAGTDRWIVTCALYIVAGCYLGTAAGLPALRIPARMGLVVAGLAAIGVATFPEPAHGESLQHGLCTGVGAVAIALWPALVVQHVSPASAIVGVRASAAASAISLAMLAWIAIEIDGGSALGLAERLSSSLQLCWPFIVAWSLRRAGGAAAAASNARAPGIPA